MSALGQKQTCAVQLGMSAKCQKQTSRRFTCSSLKIERELELPHDHLVQCQRKGSVMYRSTNRAQKVHTLGKKINAECQTADRAPSGHSFACPFRDCTTDDRRPVGQHYQ